MCGTRTNDGSDACRGEHRRAFFSFSHSFRSSEPFVLNDVLPAAENSRRLSLEAEKEEVIPDVPLTSRSRLGPFLKFVNREQSINVLLKHAADQYAKYLHGFGEKEAQFAACSGGPGLGKVSIVTGADLAPISHFILCRRRFVAKPSAAR